MLFHHWAVFSFLLYTPVVLDLSGGSCRLIFCFV
jgi:hypothetical protein